jgi:purine nucleoside phosphorylase
MAAGILPQKLVHSEVLETGERVRGVFTELLQELIPRLVKLD